MQLWGPNTSAYSDSQLIVGQVNGEFEPKDDNMRMYLQKLKIVIEQLEKFSFSHIPRSKNALAYSLTKLASSADGPKARNITWEILPSPSINQSITMVDASNTWMDPFIKYFQQGTVLDDSTLIPPFLKKVKWYAFYEGKLYKKSFTHPPLKCVTPEDGNYILREIHEEGCGIHQGVRAIINKAIGSAYYWPTLKEDVESLIKSC